MTIPAYLQPFGLRDVRLTPLSADGVTPSTGVDLPASRTFHFSDEEDFSPFRGDDQLITEHGSGPHLSWTLESGGLSLEAYAVVAGGTVTSTGTTPAVKKTYSKLVTTVRPLFRAEGQAISDNGGDMHGIAYKCKATDKIEGEMNDGAFWATSLGGSGYGSAEAATVGKLYDFIHNETAIAIP